MTTERQKAAVRFTEEVLNIKFDGDIHDFSEVSDFLGEYLAEAKDMFDDAWSGYQSFIADKDWA